MKLGKAPVTSGAGEQSSDSPSAPLWDPRKFAHLKLFYWNSGTCAHTHTKKKVFSVSLLPTTQAFHFTRLDSQCTECESIHLSVLLAPESWSLKEQSEKNWLRIGAKVKIKFVKAESREVLWNFWLSLWSVERWMQRSCWLKVLCFKSLFLKMGWRFHIQLTKQKQKGKTSVWLLDLHRSCHSNLNNWRGGFSGQDNSTECSEIFYI